MASCVTDVSTENLTDVPISHQLTEILTDNFLSVDWWINRLLTDFFFKNKKIAKIIFKMFLLFFSKIDRISTEFSFKYKKIAKIIFLFTKIFLRRFFKKYFREFPSYLRNDVFCEIFYSKFCLLRIFLFCNFGVRKRKIGKKIYNFFFSSECEYQIWKCFFSEKKVKFSLILLLDFFTHY